MAEGGTHYKLICTMYELAKGSSINNVVFRWMDGYESPILGQLLDLISQAKINFFESIFKSYDPYSMAN